MLRYLDQEDLLFMADVHQCRALGRELNLEEQFAQKLLAFDWSYRESDSGSVSRNGARREEELIAEIDDSALPDAIKMKFLKLFSMDYSSQAEVLKEYTWVNRMQYVDKDPDHGLLGLYFKGVTNDQYRAFEALAERLNTLGSMLLAAKCTDRLLMTDDCINYTLVREKAAELWKEHKDAYWFGVTVPQKAQDLLDDIVRTDKATFIKMVETGAHKRLFNSCNVDTNNPDGVWHVSVQTNRDYKQTFGFFFNPRPTRPRRDYQPKSRESDQGKPFAQRQAEIGKRVHDAQEFVDRPISEGSVDSSQRVKTTYTTPAIPTMPARVKTPMTLSNRPMTVEDKPRVKKQKAAPTKRKERTILREVKA